MQIETVTKNFNYFFRVVCLRVVFTFGVTNYIFVVCRNFFVLFGRGREREI